MTAKPKALLKHAKNKKKKEQTLDDADDYLAAGVDNEDAMGKHRAGDPVKSLRFGRRALELYTQGLAQWPKNFDLAYNKARLELEIATHPLLVKNLDVPVLDVLRQSLASHQYALIVDTDNADALFNSAQVLTGIAEQVAKDESVSDAEALQYLEQALEHQARCFHIQQQKYVESQQLRQDAPTSDEDDDEGGARVENTTSIYEDREEEERWVSVVEPVTTDSLIDTVLAQLNTLSTLCSILSLTMSSNSGQQPSVSLSWIESYSTKLLTGTLPEVLHISTDMSSRAAEIALTQAIFKSNFLELAYRSQSIDASTYRRLLEEAFAETETKSSDPTTPDVSIAYSRALIAFGSALAEDAAEPNIRWNTLSTAQKLLTSAASLPNTKADTETLATTHLLRGDTSLLLRGLSYPPVSFAQAITNSTQLLKNAETFYRNATKLFGSLGGDSQAEKEAAEFRGGVVAVLQSADMSQAKALLQSASKGKTDEWRREQLQDMIDDGLVQADTFGMQ